VTRPAARPARAAARGSAAPDNKILSVSELIAGLGAAELAAVTEGEAARGLEIDRFVELDDIDPLYYQKTYWLGPGSADTAKVYGLLRDAMADSGRAAVGTLVMRGKEYLAAIRADGNLLVLQTMYFADEVRDPKDQIDDLPRRNAAKPAELHMAQQLIDSMSGRWRPADFRDTYTDRVKDLIKAKKAGKEVTPAAAAPEPTSATDLFEVLRRSVDAASQRRKIGAASKPSGRAKASRKSAKASAKRKRDDVTEMTKRDLLKLARDLDIAGRSTKSRPELETAVRAAQRRSRRAA
jgi:DNA end-binding protein Ku